MSGRRLFLWALVLLNPAWAMAELREGAFESARLEALENGKHLYVAFLGEGWSVRSKHFKEQVLDHPAFRAFAGEQLVYFHVMARRKPPLTKEETAVLQSLVIHFDIKSYPTLILVAPDGQEVLRHGYRDMDGPAYVDLLRSLLPPEGS